MLLNATRKAKWVYRKPAVVGVFNSVGFLHIAVSVFIKHRRCYLITEA
jgi:hypothetical protein